MPRYFLLQAPTQVHQWTLDVKAHMNDLQINHENSPEGSQSVIHQQNTYNAIEQSQVILNDQLQYCTLSAFKSACDTVVDPIKRHILLQNWQNFSFTTCFAR